MQDKLNEFAGVRTWPKPYTVGDASRRRTEPGTRWRFLFHHTIGQIFGLDKADYGSLTTNVVPKCCTRVSALNVVVCRHLFNM